MYLDSITINDTKFKNRIVMPPMCMYSVFNKDGKATLFHLNHYLTRSVGGVGYIILESTAVSPNGRISNEDLGLWNDEHIDGLRKIVQSLHENSTVVGIQINHAGRKSRTDDVVGVSKHRFSDRNNIPRVLKEKEIYEIVTEFGLAAKRANIAGFDILEIHAAHGYLINQFLSPITNDRKDSFKDKSLFLRLVINEIKKYWPANKVLSIRISATDYVEDGLKVEDYISILKEFENDIRLLNVSSGGIVPYELNDYPGYQLDYAKVLKENLNMRVIGGGQLSTLLQANEALINNKADFIYFGRKLLLDPYFLLNNDENSIPKQYLRGKTLKK